MKKNLIFRAARMGIAIILLVGMNHAVRAQAELAPWGNITGIRIDGQLMEFESSIRVVRPDWSSIQSTGKERQRPHYARQGRQQIVTTAMSQLSFTETAKDSIAGSVNINVEASAKEDVTDNIYFSLNIPEQYYSKGSMQAGNGMAIPLSDSTEEINIGNSVGSLRFTSSERRLELYFSELVPIIVKRETGNGKSHLQFYIPIHTGTLLKDSIVRKTFTIIASGQVDKSPVALQINTSETGRPFAGFGGNFRLQNSKTDPLVIDYCLQNLRVAWGRVEMPWSYWQPGRSDHPLDSARNGSLHPAVKSAMEMARRLGKKGIPIILSTWSAPGWAVVGEPRSRPGPDGVWGNPLNQDSIADIYRSIGDYIVCLKEQFGVEVSLFSFNESDIGINIRQTGKEHADLIKGLGAYFVRRGLKTKMLLGDNSDATSYRFIEPALNDPATYPYIGAISFHSWRGWEKETLEKWADAATRLNRPLIVAEGSIDAQAWGYPAVFEESSYALQEINLYIRLLSVCQPLSILQWQLTADYSPLSGGGIFGNNEPLHPTQRFWNLKQLASTPQGLRAIGAHSDKSTVTVAALGDVKKGIYAIHIVNTGPARMAGLSGLPANLKSLRVFVTDKHRTMQEEKKILLNNSRAEFALQPGTYTTLKSE